MEFFAFISQYVSPIIIAIYAAVKAFLASKDGIRKKRAPYEGKSKYIRGPNGEIIEFVYHNDMWVTKANYVEAIKKGE